MTMSEAAAVVARLSRRYPDDQELIWLSEQMGRAKTEKKPEGDKQ